MMELMAEQFPGCFSGYKLHVAESHQRTKVVFCLHSLV